MIFRLLLLCSLVLVGCEDSDSGVVIFLPSGDAETPSTAADSTIEVDLRMSGAFDAGVEIDMGGDTVTQDAGMCGLNSRMAEPCRADCDCASRHPFTRAGNTFTRDIEQVCMTQEAYGFPEGYCTIPRCHADVVSDPCERFNYECLSIGRTTSGQIVSACLKPCDTDSDCPSNRVCQTLQDERFCWPRCGFLWPCLDSRLSCNENGRCVDESTCVPTTCAEQGVTCGTTDDGCGRVLDCGPPCPLDGCTDWSEWSCVDRSPTSCSCSCSAWAHSGSAPRIECLLVSAGEVVCSCNTGGEQVERGEQSFEAGGAGCGQVEQVFMGDFCGLAP